MTLEPEALQTELARLHDELAQLRAAEHVAQRLSKVLDLDALARDLVLVVTELTHYQRALVLVLDEGEVALNFGAINPALPTDEWMTALRNLFISRHQPDDPIIRTWVEGVPCQIAPRELPSESPIQWIARMLQADGFYSLPLIFADDRLAGVLLLDRHADEAGSGERDRAFLRKLAQSLAISLENARVHSKTVKDLATKMRELYILRQIDRELNETIDLNHVFDMTLDWALRYTNAQAASIAFYDESSGELRYVADLGYSVPKEQLDSARAEHGLSPAHRTARSGRVEVIPDVTMDKDYLRLSGSIRAQLCAPIMREDRVIAVMSIESKRLNAFSDEHVEFVEKLTARAGVAIDNARLFGETVREREKLSRILRNTADVVIVVNEDGRIDLINQSTLAVMRLHTEADYLRHEFSIVFAGTPLGTLYEQALDSGLVTVGEVLMPDERSFHANLAPYEGIGWIIVLHDITPMKETDRLKNELIATVSHDLKQPLSVMYGYSELLLMQPTLDAHSVSYTTMIQRSISSMRQLIDDLLDLAKIESGVQLKANGISIHGIIQDCMDSVRPIAEGKAMALAADLPDTLPMVRGERSYLNQIFVNIVGNAVKYTPPEGSVRISAERSGVYLRIAVTDTGLGISPEDQARIFDRFYRVRRPETDSIDGTGLGLAIVKRLIELHEGQIGLESRLGEGTTFYVTLPIYEGIETYN